MFLFMSRVFGTCWPIFTWKFGASGDDISLKQNFVDRFLMVAWVVATSLKLQFDEAEEVMRSLAYLSIKDDQERFAQLVDFRRIVGNCYEGLKRSRASINDYWEHSVTEMSYDPPLYLLGAGIDWQLREDVKKPLRIHLDELEKKLDAIKDDLNEELQVVVGTVQVREAQLMREQARVTAQQTTWTVALTVLAAVYLPMTLVTGIFGMNITEISSEATAPNAWWAFGAWVVVAALTVSGILSYVAISKLRARKKKSDLEANNEGEKSNAKDKTNSGKQFVDTSKDWIRWLKQKAKTVWTTKQE
jgi:hypothetical protein